MNILYELSLLTVKVVWKADFPAFFGNITYLQCNIFDTADNCTQSTRQWIGGPRYRSLCHENKCDSSNKYEIMNQASCLYTLMIRNFTEQDVNCEYTCSYGVSRNRKNLTLDEERFIYIPQVEEIKEEVIEKYKTLNWKINITKVFPKPSCWTDLNGKSLTADIKISVTKPGFFYATDLQIDYNVSSCGIMNVYCHLGDYKMSIASKNIESCQGAIKSSSKNTTIVVVLIVSSLFCVGMVLLVYFYLKKKNNQCCYGRGDCNRTVMSYQQRKQHLRKATDAENEDMNDEDYKPSLNRKTIKSEIKAKAYRNVAQASRSRRHRQAVDSADDSPEKQPKRGKRRKNKSESEATSPKRKKGRKKNIKKEALHDAVFDNIETPE
ncbi:Hypothetical predicted protein [Mytilus galloprovincialis]|uniref:Uncharacterized protein n=1 Tax=Mytilus galloprovincialis TaxID=29158 RepID=A0A8B6GTH9_MYTGA|nr:Hypothetical predicted protein [Mytilus galloprovincialis]